MLYLGFIDLNRTVALNFNYRPDQNFVTQNHLRKLPNMSSPPEIISIADDMSDEMKEKIIDICILAIAKTTEPDEAANDIRSHLDATFGGHWSVGIGLQYGVSFNAVTGTSIKFLLGDTKLIVWQGRRN